MPKPPKPISEIDQSKAGLQDDHDARDPVQKQNDPTQTASMAYAPSSQDPKGQPQNPPKEEQKGAQKK